MVEIVRLDQAFGIALLWHPAEIALMHEPVVHQRIDDSIEENP